jgi:hypothetical protein
MASTDSKATAFWGVAHRITFPLLDADGDLVTGATTPDSEISKDNGTFTDCTNEMTEIATSSGVYYLDLTATEMEADQIAIIAKSATAGMKTTVIVIYPEQGIRTRKATAGAAGSITLDASANATDDFYNDCMVRIVGGTGVGQARLISDYTGSSKLANVVPNWVTNPDTTSIFHIIPSGRVDVGQWVDVAPNALVSGRVDSSVGAMAANVLTATAINADAITEAKIAAGAIDAATFAAGAIDAAAIGTGAIDADALAADAITAAKIANGAIDAATFAAGAIDAAAIASDAIAAAKIATGAITAAKFAAGAIDAAAIAADAITAAKVAADVSAEIADAVWDELKAGHAVADSFGDFLDIEVSSRLATAGYTTPPTAAAIRAEMDANSVDLDAIGALATAIQADTDNIQTRIPAALVGGRIDASVGAMAADVITAAALATDAVNELADGLLSRDIDQVEAAAAVHSLASAVLKLVSRFKATTGQTYRTNGTTVHMTQTPVNDPITAISELGVGA